MAKENLKHLRSPFAKVAEETITPILSKVYFRFGTLDGEHYSSSKV